MTVEQAQSLENLSLWSAGAIIAGFIILVLFYEFKSREKR